MWGGGDGAGRGWEIFTRNRRKPRIERLGFIIGRFFNIVGRGVLTLLFYEDPHILPPSLFFNFSPPPPPPYIPLNTPSCHLQPPSHSSFCSFCSHCFWAKKIRFLASNFLILASNRFTVPQIFL